MNCSFCGDLCTGHLCAGCGLLACPNCVHYIDAPENMCTVCALESVGGPKKPTGKKLHALKLQKRVRDLLRIEAELKKR